jgi:hypothetical protein
LRSDSTALQVGLHLNRIGAWSFVFFGISFVLFGVVRANGAVIAPLLILVITLLGLRFPLALLLLNRYHADAIWWSFPLSSAVAVALAMAYYKFGGWRQARMMAPPHGAAARRGRPGDERGARGSDTRRDSRRLGGRARLDPERPRVRTQLAVLVEQGRARLVLAPARADAPTDHHAALIDVDAPIDVRCKFPEQRDARITRNGQPARAVECRPHELRPHLAVTAVERAVRDPRRRDQLALRHRSGKDPQPVTARAAGPANEAGGKGVVHEAGVVA